MPKATPVSTEIENASTGDHIFFQGTSVDGGVQYRDFDFVTVAFEGEVTPRGIKHARRFHNTLFLFEKSFR